MFNNIDQVRYPINKNIYKTIGHVSEIFARDDLAEYDYAKNLIWARVRFPVWNSVYVNVRDQIVTCMKWGNNV